MMRAAALRIVGSSIALVVAVVGATVARAQSVPETVYPPPEPTISDDPSNAASGVRFKLDVGYATDYIWRGIERFDVGKHEDSANVQYDGRLSFDLGKLPTPYVNLFVNTSTGDPVSSFEEVRPEAGFDWNIRPLTVSAGYINYNFPDRKGIDTSEVFARLAFDDSLLFRSERPIFNPYVFAAYDVDVFDGLYVEAGLRHEIPVDNTGLKFILNANVAYVDGFELFSRDGDERSGFQHWQVGVEARYTLNTLLNIPDRFGQLSAFGYVNYTDRIDDKLNATDQIWGGGGVSIEF